MTYTYTLHPLAKKDIIKASDWYENISEELADRFVNAVEKKIEKISLRPLSYGSKGNRQYREALIPGFPYLIVFKIYKEQKLIFIYSVYHTKKSLRGKYRK